LPGRLPGACPVEAKDIGVERMSRNSKAMGLGIGLGAALGVALGVMAGHIAVWLGIGVAIGMAIGSRLRPTVCARCEAAKRNEELELRS
jgi:hypothetical protein